VALCTAAQSVVVAALAAVLPTMASVFRAPARGGLVPAAAAAAASPVPTLGKPLPSDALKERGSAKPAIAAAPMEPVAAAAVAPSQLQAPHPPSGDAGRRASDARPRAVFFRQPDGRLRTAAAAGGDGGCGGGGGAIAGMGAPLSFRRRW